MPIRSFQLPTPAVQLHRVVAHAARRTEGRPFIIKLYLHFGKYGQPDAVRAEHARDCNVSATTFPAARNPAAEFHGAAEGGPGAAPVTAWPRPLAEGASPLEGYRAKPRTYKWGAQGLYVSDGATRRRLAVCYLNFTARALERQRRLKVRGGDTVRRVARHVRRHVRKMVSEMVSEEEASIHPEGLAAEQHVRSHP
jgi:hypothetical protein